MKITWLGQAELMFETMGSNMNFADGKKFCEKLGAVAVPMHCGLFDDLDMNNFEYDKK